MPAPNPRRGRSPLEPAKLEELALRYVGRFATTRAKLLAYLQRKVRERGWGGDQPADLDEIADRFVRVGYVDDAGFALAKARALAGRGYGKSRLVQSLRAAGVAEEDTADARALADGEAVDAAIRFARRKRLGPFCDDRPDPKKLEKSLAAMVRAGHSFALSKAILSLEPGSEPPVNFSLT